MKLKKIEPVILVVLGLIFIFPPFVKITTFPKPRFSFTLPHVLNRFNDESQYLVILNSILKDGDLDLRNNYYNVAFNNALDAGTLARGTQFSRLTAVVDSENEFLILGEQKSSYFEDAFNKGVVSLPDGRHVPLNDVREYSICSVGLPVTAAIFLWPFKNSRFIEPAFCLLSTVFSLLGFYFLYKMLLILGGSKRNVVFIVCCFMFGTSLWYYSGALFKESYVMALLVV